MYLHSGSVGVSAAPPPSGPWPGFASLPPEATLVWAHLSGFLFSVLAGPANPRHLVHSFTDALKQKIKKTPSQALLLPHGRLALPALWFPAKPALQRESCGFFIRAEASLEDGREHCSTSSRSAPLLHGAWGLGGLTTGPQIAAPPPHGHPRPAFPLSQFSPSHPLRLLSSPAVPLP